MNFLFRNGNLNGFLVLGSQEVILGHWNFTKLFWDLTGLFRNCIKSFLNPNWHVKVWSLDNIFILEYKMKTWGLDATCRIYLNIKQNK